VPSAPEQRDPTDTPANRFFLTLLIVLIVGSYVLGGLIVVGVTGLLAYSVFDGGGLAMAVLRFLKWPLIVLGGLMVVGVVQPFLITLLAKRRGPTAS